MKILNRIRHFGFKDSSRKSYSQCGEDLIAAFLFDQGKTSNGIYVDVGAHHPTYLSNTYYFYKRNWRGYNIDPLKVNIELFRQKRPRDINIQAGIGSITERREFYTVDPPTLSTFNKDVAANYEKLGHRILATNLVDFLSPRELIGRYQIPIDVDLLSIDIEGGEFEVINELLHAGMRPKVIICETVEYAPKIANAKKKIDSGNVMKNNGYIIFADTFINTVYVDNGFWQSHK
jgi:FkbM family methyltransferase